MIPKSHPRYLSLLTREKIVDGVNKGVTSIHGLIAHGRGEAFDYLIKERTNDFAKKAIDAAAAMLLLAKLPVLSINGNVAALVSSEIGKLSKIIPAKVEVNIFHSSKAREVKIKKHLLKNGAKEVLMPKKKLIKGIEHNRSFCNPEGIYKSDVVFVPLEDGDRCKALKKMGKKIIVVDLNPLSRTAKTADITIVDNIIRTMPLLISMVNKYKKLDRKKLRKIIKDYNNKKILAASLKAVR
ncbi:phosphopantothenate/pantothenate synthetase [Candidatus Woesearchaeota archaeon]|nr:phosphopantothenate/pantothenate synthetase [Candidatus Woesearchaeota archaeon]